MKLKIGSQLFVALFMLCMATATVYAQTVPSIEQMNVEQLVAHIEKLDGDIRGVETALPALTQKRDAAMVAWMADGGSADLRKVYLDQNNIVLSQERDLRRWMLDLGAARAQLQRLETQQLRLEMKEGFAGLNRRLGEGDPHTNHAVPNSTRGGILNRMVDEEEDSFLKALSETEAFLAADTPESGGGSSTNEQFVIRVRSAGQIDSYLTNRTEVLEMARSVREIYKNYRRDEGDAQNPENAQALRAALDSFEIQLLRLLAQNQQTVEDSRYAGMDGDEEGIRTGAPQVGTFVKRLLDQVRSYRAWMFQGQVAERGDQAQAAEAEAQAQQMADLAEMLRQWRSENQNRMETRHERFIREVHRLAEAGDREKLDELLRRFIEDNPSMQESARRTVNRCWEGRRQQRDSSSPRQREEVGVVGALRIYAPGWRVIGIASTPGHSPINAKQKTFRYIPGETYEYEIQLARVDARGNWIRDADGQRIERNAATLANNDQSPVTVSVITNISANGGRGISYPMELKNGRFVISTSELTGGSIAPSQHRH